MGDKTILGYIDCPGCGAPHGMRITNDKNGHPFGFCTANCGQQLRVGPNAERIAHFRKRYPWAEPKEAAPEGPAAAPAGPPADAKPAPAPVPAPAPKKPASAAPARSSMADALAFLGVRA